MNRSAKTAGSIKGCLPKILTFICKFSKRALNVFPTGRYISSAMVFSIRFSTSRYVISLPQTQTEPIKSNSRTSQTVYDFCKNICDNSGFRFNSRAQKIQLNCCLNFFCFTFSRTKGV